MAILNFKYGFSYKGVNYGWLLEELWRLPSTSGGRSFPLKKQEVKKRENGSKYYRLKRDKKSIPQLQTITKEINTQVEYIRNQKDTPF